MSRTRLRQHVNPLGMGFQELRDHALDLDWSRELELEIGCAEAQFLFERAAQDASRLYIGLEIREALVEWVNQMANRQGVPVQAVFCNANNHLRQLVPAASIRRVFLNFPDPWFKKRHRKRRMIDRELARDIHHVLAPGGELFFQSDVWEVALDTMDIFERLDDLYVNRAGEWSFWKDGNPYGARSWREEHCQGGGLPIWRLWYCRT